MGGHQSLVITREREQDLLQQIAEAQGHIADLTARVNRSDTDLSICTAQATALTAGLGVCQTQNSNLHGVQYDNFVVVRFLLKPLLQVSPGARVQFAAVGRTWRYDGAQRAVVLRTTVDHHLPALQFGFEDVREHGDGLLVAYARGAGHEFRRAGLVYADDSSADGTLRINPDAANGPGEYRWMFALADHQTPTTAPALTVWSMTPGTLRDGAWPSRAVTVADNDGGLRLTSGPVGATVWTLLQ